MTLTLELTSDQEVILRQKAAEAGQEPEEYLLTAAGIIIQSDLDPDTIDDPEVESAYDLFRGLIGGFRSGDGQLSENTGKAFAEGMIVKRQQGHL